MRAERAAWSYIQTAGAPNGHNVSAHDCQVLHLSFSLMANFAFASVQLLQLLYWASPPSFQFSLWMLLALSLIISEPLHRFLSGVPRPLITGASISVVTEVWGTKCMAPIVRIKESVLEIEKMSYHWTQYYIENVPEHQLHIVYLFELCKSLNHYIGVEVLTRVVLGVQLSSILNKSV